MKIVAQDPGLMLDLSDPSAIGLARVLIGSLRDKAFLILKGSAI